MEKIEREPNSSKKEGYDRIRFGEGRAEDKQAVT